MDNSISKNFNFISLIKFSLPTIIMMMFTSLYVIVDGIFVSRFVNTDALSAVNITYPFTSLIIAVAIMFASGGSAIVATLIGEGNTKKALKSFTLIVTTAFIISVIISSLGLIFINPLIEFLGAKGDIVIYAKDYLRILLFFAPFSVLQMVFQNFYITAGKPHLGLAISIIAGLSNALLDYLFMGPLNMGISGAAYATISGYLIAGLFGLWFFNSKYSSIHFKKFKIDWLILKNTCFNGSSEMVTNLSTSVITLLFNIIMMRYLGSDGVAAMAIVLYAQFLMVSLFMGFSMGVAPVISYNYGSENHTHLRKIFKINQQFIIGASIFIFILAQLLNSPIASIFTAKGTNVYTLTVHGFFLFSFSFLFAGINIYTSALFTALSNGKVSATISFARTFVFILLGILFLPKVLNIDGIWLAVPFAELLTFVMSVYFLKRLKL